MNRRQDVLSIPSDQDRPTQPCKFSITSGLRVPGHHLDMSVRIFFLDKPGHTGPTCQCRRESELLEIDASFMGDIRVDKYPALLRQHLIFDAPVHSWPCFKGTNRSDGHVLQKCEPDLQVHDAQKRIVRTENGSRKSDRIDTTLGGPLHSDVGHIESSRRTRSRERCGTAIVTSYERRLRCRHDRTLNVHDRDRQINWGILLLHPLEILGE